MHGTLCRSNFVAHPLTARFVAVLKHFDFLSFIPIDIAFYSLQWRSRTFGRLVWWSNLPPYCLRFWTRRPASADRTARRQFQATGQPVIRTQASDAMTSRLPRYEAKCVQRRCFQCASVPLRSDIKGTELPPANILIPLERQLIVLQLCR